MRQERARIIMKSHVHRTREFEVVCVCMMRSSKCAEISHPDTRRELIEFVILSNRKPRDRCKKYVSQEASE